MKDIHCQPSRSNACVILSSHPSRLEGGKHFRSGMTPSSDPACPTVSIITIVRNDREHIEDTIRSIQSQSYGNREHIIIDGGSTDGTVEIIRKYDDAVSYWLSEPDEGISDAFNKGLAAARGEWIIFLNSADTFTTDQSIAMLMQHARGKKIVTAFARASRKLLPKRAIRDSEPVHIRAMIAHQASLVHRSIFDEFGGFDRNFKVRMDYEFWLRVLPRTPFHFVEEIVVQFADNGVSGNLPRYIHEELLANKKCRGRYGLLDFPRIRFFLERWLCKHK